MTINQIACFVEAAKAGNISKAAEYLFITQQAASSQIKALEKELGFRVLQRENRGVSLTEEGKILFEDWKDIQERYRISVDRAKDYHSKRSKNIRIGLEDMGKCSEDIMQGFAEYESKYADLHIKFEVMSPRRIIRQFESGNLDMAIVYDSEFQGHTELKSLPLHERKLDVCLFISGKHPLAKKKTLTLQDLKEVPIGILGEEYSLDFKRLTQHFFEYNHAEPPSEYEVYESRRDLEINLIAGRCAAIVYETMFDDRDHKLKSFPVDVDNNSFGISLFWQRDEMRTKAAALWRIIKEKMNRDR